MTLGSNKKSVQFLIQYLKLTGIKNIVICPGSRNVPFVVSIHEEDSFNIKSIVDERVACFVALGMSKIDKNPTVIITSSGSAVVNLAPAILEAYYNEIPLLVITADRPISELNIGSNQTFEQQDVFKNYIKYSTSIIEFIDKSAFEQEISIIHNFLFDTKNYGPVHLNFHFEEPLANKEKIEFLPLQLNYSNTLDKQLLNTEYQYIESLFCISNFLFYISEGEYSKEEKDILLSISKNYNIPVFTELLANIMDENFSNDIELFIAASYLLVPPKIVITIGKQMISKRFRTYLISNPNIIHIDVHPQRREWNFFSNQFHFIHSDINNFLIQIESILKRNIPSNINHYLDSILKCRVYRNEILNKGLYNEFSITNRLFTLFAPDSMVFWGNSSPIRYANNSQYYIRTDLKHYANRGISGIDGVLATAIGAKSIHSNKTCYCVLGDIAALYETNSFWASNIIDDIIVILLNNNGGKIFNSIHANLLPSELSLITTKHSISFEKIANTYDFEYNYIDQSSLHLLELYMNKKGKIMIEIGFELSNSDTLHDFVTNYK